MIIQLHFASIRSTFLALSCVSVFVLILFSGLSLEAAERGNVSIRNVKIRQIEAEKFRRISEFFTGRENTSGRVFLRSKPEQRGGLYFITRMDDKLTNLPAGTRVGVDFFEVGSAQMRQYLFELPSDVKATSKLFIGITDKGMLKKQLPVAWRVYLLNADESLYSELKSYLWEMPEKRDQED